MKKLILALIISLLISGCDGSADPNVVSRGVIAEFCDAVSYKSKDIFDHGAALKFGVTSDQAVAMSRGAQWARWIEDVTLDKQIWEKDCNKFVTRELDEMQKDPEGYKKSGPLPFSNVD